MKNTTFDRMPFLKVVDSSASIPPGIFRGPKMFYGLYTECKDIRYDVPGQNRKFETIYSRIFVSSNLIQKIILTNATSISYKDPETCMDVLGLLGIDMCLPKSCSDKDILNFARKLTNGDKSPVCRVKTMRKAYLRKDNAGTWIVGAIMLFITILGITASVYDYFIYPLHKNRPYLNRMDIKCWRAFSLYTNISDTFNTGGPVKASQIRPINCMRFFCCSWVTMFHAFEMIRNFSTNPLDYYENTKEWMMQMNTNPFFSVDTFLFISGLLLTFTWFRKYEANKKKTTSTLAWVMFYVHRILRLTPNYYFIIAFYMFIFPLLFEGNLLNIDLYFDPDNNICYENWWVNLLYLVNLVNVDRQCYLVSWFLSTNLHIFIFSPLLILPFTFNPLYGIIVSTIAIIISTAANFFTIIYYRFPPSDFGSGPRDPLMTVPHYKYTQLIFDAPWIRCQIFIIGMLVGYFLHKKKKLDIHWALNIILWMAAFVFLILDLIALRSWSGEHQYMDIGWRAIYSAFSKPIWGLCLSWIIISCYYGYGGFINDFMSWNIWVPFRRLAYSAYLLHECVMYYFMGLSQNGLTYTSFAQTYLLFALPQICVSYFLAIFWSALFEFGFEKVEIIVTGAIIGKYFSPSSKIGDKNTENGKINEMETLT